MRRVDARLSASRSMVAISRTVGKAENSSGVWMNSEVIRISTDRMIDTARNRSSSTGGSGRIRTTRMVITPMASARSPRRNRSPSSARLKPRAGALFVAATSVIGGRRTDDRGRMKDGRGSWPAVQSHLSSVLCPPSSGSRPARRGNCQSVGSVFVELVAQRADRDAEDVGRMGAVAEAVLERLEDEVALDIGDGAADESTGDLLG